MFPTGALYSKSKNVDLKSQGSGNTGMTNSLRVMGWKAGIIVFIGDCFKAIFAMIISWALCKYALPTDPEAGRLFMLYAGFGAILGHNFPFYSKFKGGKGIASSVGVIAGFHWQMLVICAIGFFGFVVPTGFMSLGSLAILTTFFIQVIVFGQLGWLHIGAQFLPEVYVIAFILCALAYYTHRENIKRLAAGKENKFVPKKK